MNAEGLAVPDHLSSVPVVASEGARSPEFWARSLKRKGHFDRSRGQTIGANHASPVSEFDQVGLLS